MYSVDVIILAAGKSTRMDMSLNKQFIDLCGKPVIYYSLNKFINQEYIKNIILVVNEEFEEYFKINIIEKFSFSGIKIVLGGDTRQESIKNALKYVVNDYVMIHDGARPCVTTKIIADGVKNAYKYGASSCYVVPKDTIKISENGMTKVLDRERLICVQTPQCFLREYIISAYDFVNKHNKSITDESSALDFIGKQTYFYLGSYFNIKITTKEDLVFAEEILRMDFK